eukprot:6185672-Pleurochrysis_carterae.AAC.1
MLFETAIIVLVIPRMHAGQLPRLWQKPADEQMTNAGNLHQCGSTAASVTACPKRKNASVWQINAGQVHCRGEATEMLSEERIGEDRSGEVSSGALWEQLGDLGSGGNGLKICYVGYLGRCSECDANGSCLC